MSGSCDYKFEQAIKTIAPAFRPYVNILRDKRCEELCRSKIDVEHITFITNEWSNQFELVLPYCSKKLHWDVIFDLTMPNCAPDFRFNDETFLSVVDENLIEQRIPSLANWNANDPNALYDVMTELLCLYKEHQKQKLNKDETSRANFEYEMLLKNSIISDTDIEIFVDGENVQFAVNLKVNISNLPDLFKYSTKKNPGHDFALLLVNYPNSANTELLLSPLLIRTIGNINPPRMQQSGVLMDYIPMLTNFINNKIQNVLLNEEKKRQLFTKMIVKYEGSILEYYEDKATFLFEHEEFYCMLLIKMDSQVPEMSLISIYHLHHGQPYLKKLTFTYENFEEYLKQEIELFKQECVPVL